MFTGDQGAAPDPDDPRAVVTYLLEPLRQLRDALDGGVSLADSVMDDLDPDNHLWAHLVRHHALSLLRKQRSPAWALGRDLANSGIEIVAGPFILRPLKAARDLPPNPGRNGARQRFWQQIQPEYRQPRLFDLHVPASSKTNLIADWGLNETRDVVLALSKPQGIWDYEGEPDLEWRTRITFPPTAEPKFDHGNDEVQADESGEGEAI